MSNYQSLREAQLKFNIAMMDHLEKRERWRVEKRWVINKDQFEKDKAYNQLLALRDVPMAIPMEAITPPPNYYQDILLPDGKMGWIFKSTKELLEEQFSDAAMAWGAKFESMAQTDFQPFGTAPVKKAYWQIKVPKEYQPICLMYNEYIDSLVNEQLAKGNLISSYPKENDKCTFKRYPSLGMVPCELDILTQAFLGLTIPLGIKYAQSQNILNDSWTVNLKERLACLPENILVDCFLDSRKNKNSRRVK